MRASSSAALAEDSTEPPRLLERQRALEIELMQARQCHRGPKRKHAAAAAASIPPAEEAGGDAWMLTYLDMMTLLLVVTMAMLALAGKGHGHAHTQESGLLDSISKAQDLTHVAPPGSLLLVPKFKAPTEPEPTPEPIVNVDTQTLDTSTPPVAALQPPAAEVPAAPQASPHAPAEPSVEDLLKELPLDKLGDDIEVISNARSVSFRINSEILFPSGQTDLNLGGLKVLQHLIPVLESVSYRIVVAGHTDTQDIRSSRFPSNWELSGARAGSVVRYLQSNGIKSDRLAAVGYADTRPLAGNDTAKGRASNRRVELTLER
jgi:chemotaxis protein MotB